MTTTEEGTDKTLDIMRVKPLNGEAILGVSGFFILNLAAARGQKTNQPLKYIICVDVSEKVANFWKEMEKIICASQNRHEALEKIQKFFLQNKESLFDKQTNTNFRALNTLAEIRVEIEKGKSWLSTDESYLIIKKIFNLGQFVFKRIDLCDKTSVQSLARTIHQAGITLDVVYLSNVIEYAEIQRKLPSFQNAIEHLKLVSNDETLFIRTRPRTIKQLVDSPFSSGQQVVLKKFVSANVKQTFVPSLKLETIAEDDELQMKIALQLRIADLM